MAVIGTKYINKLESLGPFLIDARKNIEVPNDIASTASAIRFIQNIQSNSNADVRFKPDANNKDMIVENKKLQKL